MTLGTGRKRLGRKALRNFHKGDNFFNLIILSVFSERNECPSVQESRRGIVIAAQVRILDLISSVGSKVAM